MIQDDHLPNMATLHMSQTREIPTELRIKNRRKRYLESHPEYFGTSLELAGKYDMNQKRPIPTVFPSSLTPGMLIVQLTIM